MPLTDVTLEAVTISIDENNVNEFAAVENGRIVVKWPFTEDRAAFELVVVNRESEEELYRGRYQFAHSELIDKVSLETSFQSDATWQVYGRQKPQQGLEQRSFVDNDTRASANGLSQGYAAAQYQSPAAFARLALGDVAVELSNELIGTSMNSRGGAFTTRFLDQRLQLRGGRIYGADIVGAQRGLALRHERNQRTGLDASLVALQKEDLSLKLHVSYLDAERPAAENFNVGGVNNGEENRIWGGGLELGLFQDRLRYKATYARSDYSNPSDLNFDNETGTSADVATTSGSGHSHRLDAMVFQGDELGIEAYGGYSFIDPLYYSMVALPAIDRETYEAGFSLSYRFVQFRLSGTRFENNVDDVPNILKTRQESRQAELNLTLEEYRGMQPSEEQEQECKPAADPGARRFIPSNFGLSYQEERVRTLNAATVIANSSIDPSEMPKQVTRNYGLNLS